MSSWKIETRAHRERAQPAARAHLGLLEKKQDYKARAKNYANKKTQLLILRRKAEARNPDEFYHAMQSTKTKKGVHKIAAERGELGKDTLAMLKTQDIGYVNLMAGKESAKIDKLRANLHELTGPKSGAAAARGKHTLFLEEDEAKDFDAAKFFDTAPELVDRAFNRPRLSTLASQSVQAPVDGMTLKRLRKHRDAAYDELDERTERLKMLRRTAAHFEAQKASLSKGRRVKVAEAAHGMPAKFKWKQQRKK